MANITISEVDLAIPEFWANIALGALKANTVMAQLVNRDYDAEVATKGDVVNIIKRGAVTVRDKSANKPITLQTPSDDKIPVTLDKHKEVSWLIEDVASAKAISSAVDYVQDAAIAIAEDIDANLLGLYTTAGGNVGEAGVNLVPDVIVDARTALNTNKVPLAERFLVISSKDDGALLKQEKFTSANWITDNQRALRDGYIDKKFGFWIFMDQQVKTSGASPTTTHNLAFTRDAFVLVSRPLPAPPTGAGATSAVIEIDGIAVRVTRSYSHQDLGTVFSLDLLYGYRDMRAETHAVEVYT